MKKILEYFKIQNKRRVLAFAILGITIGLVAYIFKVSNATSYLSNDAGTCINCHVMNPSYATWNHSSHRENANCNDCHVPHNNFVSKLFFKASDGLRHSWVFTMRNEPQVIKTKDKSKVVVQNNCIRCHDNENEHVNTINIKTVSHKNEGKGNLCWDCHTDVPHGSTKSLSITTDMIGKTPKNIKRVPDWIK